MYLRFVKKLSWLSILCFASFIHSTESTLLTTKQQFELAQFTTFAGKTIKQVKVGWESYGQLNADKSNVILITHYFTGNSHAAGKYHSSDKNVGYWDAIIGPNKAIDTNKYFVISVDSLANLGVHNPKVITTGPASINPDTGKPYGLSFPVVTIRDFVNVQKAVLESLGISKLHAVVGASMGSMQALDWAATYPNWVERMVSVIGSGQSDAWTTSLLEFWAMPIKLDPNWNQGNYYDNQFPIKGLTQALMAITQQALAPAYFNQQNPQHTPLENAPLNDIRQQHGVVKWLTNRAAARAQQMDANHLLYLVRACQLYLAGHQDNLSQGLPKVKAPSLFLPSSNDLLLMPYLAKESHQKLLVAGKRSSYLEIEGDLGHLNGINHIQQHGTTLATFLATEI